MSEIKQKTKCNNCKKVAKYNLATWVSSHLYKIAKDGLDIDEEINEFTDDFPNETYYCQRCAEKEGLL